MPSLAAITPVKIVPAGRTPAIARGLPVTIDVPGTWEDITVGAVKKALAEKFPKFYPTRQKLSRENDRAALSDEQKLSAVGLSEDGAVLSVKDLGPQISWTTVFLVEYGGPLLIHPLVYHFPQLFYSKPVIHSDLQKYLYAAVMIHFVKRELETLFVHRFSHSTMPAFNIFKNSAHYWVLSGISLAYALYSPTYSATSPTYLNTYRSNPNIMLAGLAVWLFAEISNLHAHVTVRNLRPAGSKARAIPRGYLFDFVSFPNYFFESLAWASVAALSGSYAAWAFVAVSSGQMLIWAQKKHRAYKKEFGEKYPRGRKAMIPFII